MLSRMHPLPALAAAFLLLLPGITPAAEDDRLQRSRQLSGELQQSLGARLKAALANAGPVTAIEVCSIEAPDIAAALSAASPARVSRTALRLRNADNAPTGEQRLVLEGFEQMLAAGGAQSIEHFRVGKDGSALYMKAIPTGGLCLTCHGAQLAPAVQEAIARRYPADQATGFAVGELRGAFVVEWPAAEVP